MATTERQLGGGLALQLMEAEAEVERLRQELSHVRAERDALRDEHHYLSTACWHSRHQDCRLACKYCDQPCRCACHPATEAARG